MDIKSTLKESGFEFSKRYGQNFITDINLLNAIVEKSGITPEDTVVEVGAGAGTLTAALAGRANRVVSFEIDDSLKQTLLITLKNRDNVEVIFEDFMKSGDITEYIGSGNYKVVANLPYYITTPVLFRFIEDMSVKPLSVSVMVQKEVADRLCAKPSTKDYGALTVAVDAYYEAKRIMNVSRNMFYPVPNVDSAVVLMTRRKDCEIADEKLLSKTISAGFAMRRKTLINNLMAAFSLQRAVCESVIAECGLPEMVRGEALDTAQYIALAAAVKRALKNRN